MKPSLHICKFNIYVNWSMTAPLIPIANTDKTPSGWGQKPARASAVGNNPALFRVLSTAPMASSITRPVVDYNSSLLAPGTLKSGRSPSSCLRGFAGGPDRVPGVELAPGQVQVSNTALLYHFWYSTRD